MKLCDSILKTLPRNSSYPYHRNFRLKFRTLLSDPNERPRAMASIRQNLAHLHLLQLVLAYWKSKNVRMQFFGRPLIT